MSRQFETLEHVSAKSHIGTMVPNGKQPLSVTHPEHAKEAHGWDPAEITSGSAQKRDWKCAEGQTFEFDQVHIHEVQHGKRLFLYSRFLYRQLMISRLL